MTNTEICAMVRELPKDAVLSRPLGRPPYLYAPDLKRLCVSYERLLAAAKDAKSSLDGEGGTAFKQHAYDRLEAAIEEAER